MRRSATILLAAVALAGGAGCGDDEPSAEEQALEEVCDARADIRTRLDELGRLTPATATADAVREDFAGILEDLRRIGDAQSELTDERRDQIEAANEAFSTTVRDVTATLLRSTSVGEARATLQGALAQLGEAYETALAPIECD